MDTLRQRMEDWTLGPVFPAFAAILLFVLVAGVILFPVELREHTRAFLATATDLATARPSVWVVAFWGGLAALASLLYLRYRAEGYGDSERMRAMLQAVHRSPDPNVFGDYPHLFRDAEARVRSVGAHARAGSAASAAPASSGDASAEARRHASLEAIHAVLAGIVDLTRYFAPTPKGTLRASIMLVAEPDREAAQPYPDVLVERLRFFDRARHRLDGLQALLHLPPELAVGRELSRSDAAPLIVLPVPHRPETPAGHRLALPGAPYALLTGRQCVYEDTRGIAERWCGDLEKAVRDEIRAFYGRGGDGSHTRSFLSVRLGGEAEPVGVLNIESDEPYVLGREREYHGTFFSLVSPLLHLLTGPVATFAAIGREAGRLYDAAEPAVADEARAAGDAATAAEASGAERVAADAGTDA